MPYRIFIILSRKDLKLAEDLAEKLERTGAKVYSVKKNALIAEKITTGIPIEMIKADEVILIVTNNSVDNQRLASQMGMAHSLKKLVTPIVHGLKKDELPSIIRHTDYVKYEELSRYISNLKKRVSEQQASEKQAKAS
jgi:hypothetical protein